MYPLSTVARPCGEQFFDAAHDFGRTRKRYVPPSREGQLAEGIAAHFAATPNKECMSPPTNRKVGPRSPGSESLAHSEGKLAAGFTAALHDIDTSPRIGRQLGPRRSPGSEHFVGSAVTLVADITAESDSSKRRLFVSHPSHADRLRGSGAAVRNDVISTESSKRHFTKAASDTSSAKTKGRRHLMDQSMKGNIGSGMMVAGSPPQRQRQPKKSEAKAQAAETDSVGVLLNTEELVSQLQKAFAHNSFRRPFLSNTKTKSTLLRRNTQAGEVIFSWPSSPSIGSVPPPVVVPPYALHSSRQNGTTFCPPQRMVPAGKRRDQVGDIICSLGKSAPSAACSDNWRHNQGPPKSVHDALADAVGISRRTVASQTMPVPEQETLTMQ